MNLEIEIFKNTIKKFDLKSELGFYFFEEKVFNENTKNEFFRYELKNNLNKIIQFTFYPCSRPITSNEIVVIVIYPNGETTTLSNFIAYKKLKRRLYIEDVSSHRFKIDCKKLSESIQSHLIKIINVLKIDFKKYLTTDERLFIPMYDPRDDY